MRKQLNSIIHLIRPKSKPHLTLKTPYLKLVFKEGAINTIKKAKGWRTDSEMAAAIGITRAYVSMLGKRRVSVSHNVMLRLAYLLNNRDKWWVFYEVIDTGDPLDPNHPIFNMEKFEGRAPYGKHSISAEFRRKDYKAEAL